MTKKEIAEKHGFINGMSLYSNTETIEQKLYEAMQEYADQEQLLIQRVSVMSEHHCGNQLTDKELFHDHCLKCGEYISED